MSTKATERITLSILVTGGAGFLGQRIVEEFLVGNSLTMSVSITVFDIKDCPETLADKVCFIKGDIRNYDAVRSACSGMDVVIHSAAIVDWGTLPESEVYAINVGGTQHVIDACRENKVPFLVFTSSLDAVYAGKPLVGIDETIPYPERHPTSYCRSKFLAEKIVLGANGPGLKVLVLRPADIYGENDPYHIDSLINMAKGGFYVRLGNGKAHSQHVYVGNMAFAHWLAVDALMNNKDVSGEVYFITDGESFNFFKFFDQIVLGAGYKIWPKNLWLPRGLAYSIGALSEIIAVMARPIKKYTPKFSRFAVTYTCTDFTFTAEKAKKDLGFYPKYDHKTAFGNTVAFYRKK
jgi:sterol-4alpha-carboxylate 3-dehydrogenase (decarboxylating)